MENLFLNVVNASVSGSVVILAVLLLRLILKKAPKKFVCLLWILVGVRLLCPFEIESDLSLQPAIPDTAQQVQTAVDAIQEIAAPQTVSAETAVPIEVQKVQTEPDELSVPKITWTRVGAVIWLAGVSALGVYSLASYLHLKRRVREAVILSKGIWACAGIDTAFILGYLRPRIYLPMGLSEENRELILAHEQAHLKRGDHWVKLIGFLALALHWLNPLVWAAYVLLCRDIEMACDERVVRDMDLAQRKSYSAALLRCSANHRSIAACPVAFGEVSVKARIQSVLNYRRPRFWISLAAVAAIVFVAVCFLTNPVSQKPETANDSDAADWGISVSVSNVTPTGLTFRITQSDAWFPEELSYGRGYSLERLIADQWEPVEPVIENYGFTTEAILLPQNQTTNLNIDWEWLYGELPAGQYRFGKSITLFDAPGDTESRTYYATFQIPDIRSEEDAEVLISCEAALKAFQAQDSYHISWVSQDSTGFFLDSYSEGSYWRHGSDWFDEYYSPVMNDGGTDYCLEKDGVRYWRSYGNNGYEGGPFDTGWERKEFRNEAGELWLRTFDWDSARISLESQTLEGNNAVIICKVESGLKFGTHTPSFSMLEFRLDRRGTLLSVTRTDYFDDNPGTFTQAITLHLESANEIARFIDETYQEAIG